MAGIYLLALFQYAWGLNFSPSFNITSLTGVEIMRITAVSFDDLEVCLKGS